ncbi:hypothetical protein [Alloyangia pacifica]|uniref:hypothetical protein n=1 Tax=Alloyangia pacifica TaxID=311180 RepID=UPI0031DD5B7A
MATKALAIDALQRLFTTLLHSCLGESLGRKAELEKFERELNLWLAEEPGLLRRSFDYLRYQWHTRPKIEFRWLKVPHTVAPLALAASGPAIAYQTANMITGEIALISFIAILILLCGAKILHSWSEAGNGRMSGPLQNIWVRVGDLLNTVKSTATAHADKDSSIEATLALAASLAAEIARVRTVDVAASFVRYTGTGHGKMKVTHRNRGSERPVGRPVRDLEFLLGHHACLHSAAPRVVADIHRFGPLGRKSPTQGQPTYRSIFIQPVISSKTKELQGFISMDCTVAHAFHGRRADDLVTLLEPLKAHIEDMI